MCTVEHVKRLQVTKDGHNLNKVSAVMDHTVTTHTGCDATRRGNRCDTHAATSNDSITNEKLKETVVVSVLVH